MPVQRLEASFDWLTSEAFGTRGFYDAGPRWERFLQRTQERGYHVARALLHFMRTNLPQRIHPSFASYVIHEPENESFVWEDGLFVTIYATSGTIFGVVLPRAPGSYAPVACGPPGSFYSVDVDEQGNAQTHHTYSGRSQDRAIVSSHIEAFLYRAWIESEIYNTLHYDETRGLNEREQAYYDHLMSSSKQSMQ